MLTKASIRIWSLRNNNYVKKSSYPINLQTLKIHCVKTCVKLPNTCVKTMKNGGYPRKKMLKIFSSKGYFVFNPGKNCRHPFFRVLCSLFHENSYSYSFLYGYYICFWRALSTSHCVYANALDRYCYFRRLLLLVLSLFQEVVALRMI